MTTEYNDLMLDVEATLAEAKGPTPWTKLQQHGWDDEVVAQIFQRANAEPSRRLAHAINRLDKMFPGASSSLAMAEIITHARTINGRRPQQIYPYAQGKVVVKRSKSVVHSIGLYLVPTTDSYARPRPKAALGVVFKFSYEAGDENHPYRIIPTLTTVAPGGNPFGVPAGPLRKSIEMAAPTTRVAQEAGIVLGKDAMKQALEAAWEGLIKLVKHHSKGAWSAHAELKRAQYRAHTARKRVNQVDAAHRGVITRRKNAAARATQDQT